MARTTDKYANPDVAHRNLDKKPSLSHRSLRVFGRKLNLERMEPDLDKMIDMHRTNPVWVDLASKELLLVVIAERRYLDRYVDGQ